MLPLPPLSVISFEATFILSEFFNLIKAEQEAAGLLKTADAEA